jgi:hypothetical protein
MAGKSKGTWYVSFQRPPGKWGHARATETFPNEFEAKKFARAKLVDTPNVSAGILDFTEPDIERPAEAVISPLHLKGARCLGI